MRVRILNKLLFRNKGLKSYSTIEKIFDHKKVQEFHEKGYAVIPKLFSASRIDELKQEIEKIIQAVDVKEIKSIFTCEHSETDKYFLESSEKISFFLEKDAVDEKGNLKYPLKDSLNKIGHGKYIYSTHILAIHDLNPKFKKFSYSDEIKYLTKSLGYISPLVVQSMYIFKNGRIGGEVDAHTDNTFIRSKPLSCLGIWVAFDDATKENGGMWGVPGSHKTNNNYFMKLEKDSNGTPNLYFGPASKPNYDLTNAVPLEAEKGSVVLLHGDFIHFSHPNFSAHQRHAYTLHVVEGRNHTWESDNWIQRKSMPFNFLNDVDTTNL